MPEMKPNSESQKRRFHTEREAYSRKYKPGRGSLEEYNKAAYGKNPTRDPEVETTVKQSQQEYRGGLTDEQKAFLKKSEGR